MSAPTMTNFQRGSQAAPRTSNPHTPGQLQFLVDLVKQIGAYDKERGLMLWMALRTEQESGQLTFRRASECIDQLKIERNELRTAAQAVTSQPRPQVPASRYAIDNDEGHTAFYRVAEKDGRVTVFVYASDAQHKLPWKTALPVLRKIEAYGLHEAEVRFGVESMTCYKCGKRLTREDSRARGVGDDCAGRA